MRWMKIGPRYSMMKTVVHVICGPTDANQLDSTFGSDVLPRSLTSISFPAMTSFCWLTSAFLSFKIFLLAGSKRPSLSGSMPPACFASWTLTSCTVVESVILMLVGSFLMGFLAAGDVSQSSRILYSWQRNVHRFVILSSAREVMLRIVAQRPEGCEVVGKLLGGLGAN